MNKRKHADADSNDESPSKHARIASPKLAYCDLVTEQEPRMRDLCPEEEEFLNDQQEADSPPEPSLLATEQTFDNVGWSLMAKTQLPELDIKLWETIDAVEIIMCVTNLPVRELCVLIAQYAQARSRHTMNVLDRCTANNYKCVPQEGDTIERVINGILQHNEKISGWVKFYRSNHDSMNYLHHAWIHNQSLKTSGPIHPFRELVPTDQICYLEIFYQDFLFSPNSVELQAVKECGGYSRTEDGISVVVDNRVKHVHQIYDYDLHSSPYVCRATVLRKCEICQDHGCRDHMYGLQKCTKREKMLCDKCIERRNHAFCDDCLAKDMIIPEA
jgi:hypothetical protein